MNRIASDEATLVSEINNMIDVEYVIIARGGKKPVSILIDEFCEEQVFPHLLPKDKFDFNAAVNIPISTSRKIIFCLCQVWV